jgi:hypothetical protein
MFFSESDDFVSETGSEGSDNISDVEATMWVKEDKTPNLGPFTGNPGVKQIPSG